MCSYLLINFGVSSNTPKIFPLNILPNNFDCSIEIGMDWFVFLVILEPPQIFLMYNNLFK